MPLRDSEFALLKIFVNNPYKVLSRVLIHDLVHRDNLAFRDRSLDVPIWRLRRVIEDDPSNPCYVQTVRGKSYVFVPDADGTPFSDESRLERMRNPLNTLFGRMALLSTAVLLAIQAGWFVLVVMQPPRHEIDGFARGVVLALQAINGEPIKGAAARAGHARASGSDVEHAAERPSARTHRAPGCSVDAASA